jgi:hypothetical protein
MPAGMDKRSKGPNWAKISSPTKVADFVRLSMYAGRMKFCIQVPTLDANSPIQISR